MKIALSVVVGAATVAVLGPGTVQAFAPVTTPHKTSSGSITITSIPRASPLASAPPLVDLEVAQASAKEALLETVKTLKEKYGTILLEKSAKEELQAAVEELENKSEPPAVEDYAQLFQGDWTLLSTTSVNQQGVDTSRLPFLQQDPLKKIRDSIREAANKYILVQQKVKSTQNDGVIDRIDNVVQYEPPEQLKELLDNLPNQISQLNINPLHVSKSKLVLIHKATVESEMPLKTKIALQSVVLNVAGNSTYLEPNGQDIAGVNLPLGEFIGAGTFETTYLDDDLRISRGKQGFVDQLRVFVRAAAETELLDEEVMATAAGADIVDAELDHEEEDEEEEIVAIDQEEDDDTAEETDDPLKPDYD